MVAEYVRVNPVNPDWPIGAVTGTNDPIFPEWPMYLMGDYYSPFGDRVVVIDTRTGCKPRTWGLPVLERTLDEARTEAHRRLKESIEND